jgi:hypothetical protein
MNVTTELTPLVGKKLLTLGHKNEFSVVDIDEKFVIVRPSAKEVERKIKTADFQNALNELLANGSMTLKTIRSFSEMNPVYIAAMLAQLTYVSYTSRPIVLKLARNAQTSTT